MKYFEQVDGKDNIHTIKNKAALHRSQSLDTVKQEKHT